MTAAPVPEVSVVVAVHNDEHYIEAAIRSVTRQTLRNIEVVVVDHGSTDRTPAILAKLAAADRRVRVLTMPQQPGDRGPGRPFNAAIDAASAPYVMVLGSDDELEPDAARTLLAAAEVTGADLVAGMTRRIAADVDGGETPWQRALYAQRREVAGIGEAPDLLWDTLSVAKLFRRSMLDEHAVRYPTDILYEDNVFIAAAYVAAKGIVVLPVPIYRWMVRVRSGRRSITNSRHNLGNLRDRIEANVRVDALLRERADAKVLAAKDARFMRHDLRLYLGDLGDRDEEYREGFLDIVGPYVAALPDDILSAEHPTTRAMVFLLRQRDLDGARGALRFLGLRGSVPVRLHREGDRVYWGERHLDTPEGRRWLDVTSLELHRLPPSAVNLYNEVESFSSPHEGVLRLSGSMLNQLGTIPEDADVRAEIVLRPRRRPGELVFPVTTLTRGDERFEFVADIDVAHRLPIRKARTQAWSAWLRVRWGSVVNETRTVVAEALPEDLSIRVHPPLPLIVGDRVVPARTHAGGLLLRVVNDSEAGRATADSLLRAARSPAAKRARAVAGKGSRRAKLALYRALRRLPRQPAMVLFESFEGRGYNDSPRAVFEELRRRRPDLHYVWSYRSARERPAFPKGVELVRRHSWRYYARLAQARWWVDNYGLPKPCEKPAGTTYVQTWHGTPMKLMFFDAPRVKAMAAKEKAFYQRFVNRWDYLVSPSGYFESTFVRAANFQGELIRSGMPRNDALFAGNNPEALAALRLRLGIPEGKTVVLYAPTYRNPEITTYVAPDLDELARRLGPDYFLLLRQHYYAGAMRVLPSQSHFARDASRHGDVNELMLVADVLVTDYSSMMFDFAVLRRPMIFYTPDLDEYVGETGTYVDLREAAPGPLVATTEELAEQLAKIDDLRADADGRIGAFLERFCDYDSGEAARQVVDRVWGAAATS